MTILDKLEDITLNARSKYMAIPTVTNFNALKKANKELKDYMNTETNPSSISMSQFLKEGYA